MTLNLDDNIQKLLKLLTPDEYNNVINLLEESEQCGLLAEVLQDVKSMYYEKPGYLDLYDCFYSAYYEWIK